MKYILIIMSFLLLVGSVRAQKTTQVTENYYTRATAWGVGTFLFLSGRGVSSRGISFFPKNYLSMAHQIIILQPPRNGE